MSSAFSEYTTVRGVAEILDMSPRTVRDLLIAGKLCPFVRAGRSIRVSLQSLKDWLEEQERLSQVTAGSGFKVLPRARSSHA